MSLIISGQGLIYAAGSSYDLPKLENLIGSISVTPRLALGAKDSDKRNYLEHFSLVGSDSPVDFDDPAVIKQVCIAYGQYHSPLEEKMTEQEAKKIELYWLVTLLHSPKSAPQDKAYAVSGLGDALCVLGYISQKESDKIIAFAAKLGDPGAKSFMRETRDQSIGKFY